MISPPWKRLLVLVKKAQQKKTPQEVVSRKADYQSP
jgi:hypothetical protein